MELPFQPVSFSKFRSEPAPAPDPEPVPELCSFTLLFLRDILPDSEFLVNWGASDSMFPGPRSDSSDGECFSQLMVLRWFAVEPRSFLSGSLVGRDLKLIPGRRLGLSGDHHLPGCHFFIWLRRRMEDGDLVEIIVN